MAALRTIPIRIDPLFLLLILVISLYNGQFVPLNVGLWAIVIVISVLFHEYGHALTALAFGQRASIHLVGFGGLTKRQGPPLRPWQEFMLVLNGPLASLLLAAIASVVYYTFSAALPPALKYLLEITIYANLFWTFLNLLPIQPLDGGQLLRITLGGFFGVRGVKISLFISFVLSLAIAVLFFISDQVLMGSFFLLFTFEAFKAWQNSLPMTDQDEDVEVHRLLSQAEREYAHGDLESALQRFNAVREQAPKGVLFQKATAKMAEILGHEEKYQEAYDLLSPLADKLDIPEQTLLQQLCLHLHLWKEAISLGNKVYKYDPTVDVAVTNALAHGSLGDVAPAIGWIQCAAHEGKEDLSDLLNRPEFDPIRHDKRFIDLQKQHDG